MVVIERMIQQIAPGKWAELEVLDKKYNVVEARLGFPPKKRFNCMMGSHDMNTIIIEREWPSLAAMEAIYEKAFADPENQALAAESASIVISNREELYTQMP